MFLNTKAVDKVFKPVCCFCFASWNEMKEAKAKGLDVLSFYYFIRVILLTPIDNIRLL